MGGFNTPVEAYHRLFSAEMAPPEQRQALRKLSLQQCARITDAGIRPGSLQKMKQLEELNLRGQRKITDASLGDLVKFSHLRSLGVRSVGITNEGVER